MIDDLIEEYLNTLEHDPNRDPNSEDYSERELARDELEAFMWWVHHTKRARITCK